jgi:hypothetical protein
VITGVSPHPARKNSYTGIFVHMSKLFDKETKTEACDRYREQNEEDQKGGRAHLAYVG